MPCAKARASEHATIARAVAATGCRGQGTLMVEPAPSSVEDELVPPPSKKSKYKSKFHPEWEMEFAVSPSWKCAEEGDLSPKYFFYLAALLCTRPR